MRVLSHMHMAYACHLTICLPSGSRRLFDEKKWTPIWHLDGVVEGIPATSSHCQPFPAVAKPSAANKQQPYSHTPSHLVCLTDQGDVRQTRLHLHRCWHGPQSFES